MFLKLVKRYDEVRDFFREFFVFFLSFLNDTEMCRSREDLGCFSYEFEGVNEKFCSYYFYGEKEI